MESFDEDLTGIGFHSPGSDIGGWHYASSLGSILLDDREAERRPRFLPSDDGRSTAPSTVDTRSSASGRGGGGGGNGSIFTDHDGKTKGSNTTSDSVAQRAMDAALLADVDELPEIVTDEDSAPANIAMQDHWYHTGAALTTTGTMASSASAIRAYAQRAQPVASDATAVVAYMPCEFSWYKDCAKTFPLHASAAGVDEWADHMVLDRTHLNSRLPQNAGCWFCPQKFNIRSDCSGDSKLRIEVYKKRMRHIAQHFLKGEKLPETPRKDEGFERHLIQNHIWRAPEETGPAGEGAQPVTPASAYRPPMTCETTQPTARRPVMEPVKDERRRRRNAAASSSGSSGSTIRARATIHQG